MVLRNNLPIKENEIKYRDTSLTSSLTQTQEKEGNFSNKWHPHPYKGFPLKQLQKELKLSAIDTFNNFTLTLQVKQSSNT